MRAKQNKSKLCIFTEYASSWRSQWVVIIGRSSKRTRHHHSHPTSSWTQTWARLVACLINDSKDRVEHYSGPQKCNLWCSSSHVDLCMPCARDNCDKPFVKRFNSFILASKVVFMEIVSLLRTVQDKHLGMKTWKPLVRTSSNAIQPPKNYVREKDLCLGVFLYGLV